MEQGARRTRGAVRRRTARACDGETFGANQGTGAPRGATSSRAVLALSMRISDDPPSRVLQTGDTHSPTVAPFGPMLLSRAAALCTRAARRHRDISQSLNLSSISISEAQPQQLPIARSLLRCRRRYCSSRCPSLLRCETQRFDTPVTTPSTRSSGRDLREMGTREVASRTNPLTRALLTLLGAGATDRGFHATHLLRYGASSAPKMGAGSSRKGTIDRSDRLRTRMSRRPSCRRACHRRARTRSRRSSRARRPGTPLPTATSELQRDEIPPATRHLDRRTWNSDCEDTRGAEERTDARELVLLRVACDVSERAPDVARDFCEGAGVRARAGCGRTTPS